MSTNDNEWRWADPAGQQRLVRTDELRAALASRAIPSNAPVWRQGWAGWVPAHEVPELQTSALAAANGVLPNVPPPPLFVVAAQSEFEGSPKVDKAAAEPPAPPRYVPMAAPSTPSVPPQVSAHPPPVAPAKVEPVMVVPKPARTAPTPSPRKVEPVKASPRKSMPPPLPPKAEPKPVARRSNPPPLPRKGASQRPPPMPPPAANEPQSIPTMFGIPALPNPSHLTPSPDATDENWSIPPEATEEPPPEVHVPVQRPTLHVFPAPPPITELPRSEAKAAAPPHPEPSPDSRSLPGNKFPTLIQFGGAPESEAAAPSESAPIVVPPPEPSQITGAVTRPPPWGEGAVGIAAGIPKQAKAPQIAPENVEELSGSMILPDESTRPSVRPMELSSSDLASEANMVAVKPAPLAAAERRGGNMGTIMGMAPPPQPVVTAKAEPPATASKSDPPPYVPLPSPSGARAFDLRDLAATRPPWFLAVAGGFGALILLGLIGIVVKIAKSGSSSGGDTPVTSATQTATAPSVPTAPTTPSATASVVAPPVASSSPVSCSLGGAAKTMAPRAQVGSGIEVRAVGGSIAIGFASGPKEGVVQFLDPTTFASSATASVKSTDSIRRVVALKGKAGTADTDRKGDPLQGRRTVVGEPLIDLGAVDGGLAWAPHGADKSITLWPLTGTGNVEALRAERAANGNGYVTFRQGTAIYFGAFGGSPVAPLGSLSKVDGLGPQVGSPAIAVSGEHAFVVWSDRASAQDPWGLRYVVFAGGKDPSAPKSFTLPPGGLGDQAMSPGVTALPGEQFLLLWTEGPTSSHQVRAIVVGVNGEAHGAPLTVSAEGVNAGQGQAAFVEGGHGLVAFLGASGKNFEVVATPISCVSK